MYETLRIVGVDLGQQRDPTAICVVERGYVPAARCITPTTGIGAASSAAPASRCAWSTT
jgi:hypothetical protein